MNINIAALLIGSTLLATTPVQAEALTAPNGDKMRIVRHADLDLATPGGRAKLDHRVALALESVCGSYANRSVEEQNKVARCRREASAKLAPQLAKIRDAHPAFAGTPSDRDVIVHTGDLDLTTDRDVARLDARVKRAAFEVCDNMIARSNQTAVTQCTWRVAQPAHATAIEIVLAARGVQTAPRGTDIALSAR